MFFSCADYLIYEEPRTFYDLVNIYGGVASNSNMIQEILKMEE